MANFFVSWLMAKGLWFMAPGVWLMAHGQSGAGLAPRPGGRAGRDPDLGTRPWAPRLGRPPIGWVMSHELLTLVVEWLRN